ncbi:MAG: MbnP family copper-binding protein [Cyanobacteria bacterium J06600_6]
MLLISNKNKHAIFLASAMVLASQSLAQAQSDMQDVAIDFAAYVGESKFVCGQSYESVGTAESTITPKDFRFYISNVALIDKNGEAVSLELEQDGKWQYQNTVLLDFEDGTSACDNGTAEMNSTIVGQVPKGDYQSLQFTMGVPEELNHDDAAIAPSPLNLTSMWWNWQGGYKFLRADLETDQEIATVGEMSNIHREHNQNGEVQVNQQTTHTSNSGGHQTTHQTSRQASIFKNGQQTHNQHSSTQTTDQGHEGHEGHGSANNNAYMIHLGSTGCSESSQSSLFGCVNPNRVEVMLEDFNPERDVVIADLGELLAQSDLSINQANTPNGCMSSPEDGDCMPIMQNLNLSSTGSESEQYFFFVE